MVSDKFNSLMYSIALENWDNAFKIIEGLKQKADSNQLPVLTDIEDAIIARKNKNYEKSKKLWKKIEKRGENLNNKLIDFAKASYFDIIADSSKTKSKSKTYHLKVKEYYEKTGDSILILLVNAWISNKSEDVAESYKKVAEELKQVENTENANIANALHYRFLASTTEKNEEKAELYKKASEEYKKAGDTKNVHLANALHYRFLVSTTEKNEEKAELHKKASEEYKKAGDTKNVHIANALHYMFLVNTTEKNEEKAELYKKASEEYKKAGDTKNVHLANALHYRFLVSTTEKNEEKAELHKKASEEYKKAGDTKNAHTSNAFHYEFLASTTEKDEEKAELYKKASEEYKKAGDTKNAHTSNALHYGFLKNITENDEEKAELYRKREKELKKVIKLYKKASDEYKKAGDTKNAHIALGNYYGWSGTAIEKDEERAELFKKASEEYKKAGDTKNAHIANALHYEFLVKITEKDEEKAELYKKASEEYKKAGNTKNVHRSNALHYRFLANTTEINEEKAELYKKASEEYKKEGNKDNTHRLLAKHYFFLYLNAKNEDESEKYLKLAVDETELGCLYLTQIAFNESKKSKANNAILIEETIKLYIKYLASKNEIFPVSSIYLCGDVTKKTAYRITKGMSEYFTFNTTSFQRGDFENSQKFKEEVKKNDFALMVLNKDINNELFYELGIVAGLGKPVMVLISKKIKFFDEYITKIATVTSDKELVFSALKLFSVIKSGESLEIKSKKEKSTIDELLQGLKEKPIIISGLELDELKLRGLHGEEK